MTKWNSLQNRQTQRQTPQELANGGDFNRYVQRLGTATRGERIEK